MLGFTKLYPKTSNSKEVIGQNMDMVPVGGTIVKKLLKMLQFESIHVNLIL